MKCVPCRLVRLGGQQACCGGLVVFLGQTMHSTEQRADQGFHAVGVGLQEIESKVKREEGCWIMELPDNTTARSQQCQSTNKTYFHGLLHHHQAVAARCKAVHMEWLAWVGKVGQYSAKNEALDVVKAQIILCS